MPIVSLYDVVFQINKSKERHISFKKLKISTSLYTLTCDGVVSHPKPDILEREVKWALESPTVNKASGRDGILVKLFKTLKDDANKMLHLICQQIWKT